MELLVDFEMADQLDMAWKKGKRDSGWVVWEPNEKTLVSFMRRYKFMIMWNDEYNMMQVR